MPFFQWPFKIYAIDADTGKPLDPNVRRKTYVTYYEVKIDGNGSKSLVAHKTVPKIGAANGKGKAKVTIEDVKTDKGGDQKAEAKAEGEKKDGAVAGKPDTEAFAKEEDDKLRALKGTNTSWKNIATEMGRPQGQLKTRWKEIEGAPQVDGEKKEQKGGEQKVQGKKGEKGDNAGKKDKNNKQNTNSNNDKKESKKQQKEQKSSQPVEKESPRTAVNETRFTMQDWQTLQEDSLFSFGELQCLSDIIARDSGQGWQRVASKFFDVTGRRVHPDDVREKFEGLAAYA